MIERNNKDTARSYFENFLNAGDLSVADRLFVPDVRFNYPLGELEGIEPIKEYIAAIKSAFPDILFTIEDLFGEEDLIACRWTLVGTQTGEFRGRAPTGKRIQVPGNTIFRMSGGSIREMWVAFNPALLV